MSFACLSTSYFGITNDLNYEFIENCIGNAEFSLL